MYSNRVSLNSFVEAPHRRKVSPLCAYYCLLSAITTFPGGFPAVSRRFPGGFPAVGFPAVPPPGKREREKKNWVFFFSHAAQCTCLALVLICVIAWSFLLRGLAFQSPSIMSKGPIPLPPSLVPSSPPLDNPPTNAILVPLHTPQSLDDPPP